MAGKPKISTKLMIVIGVLAVGCFAIAQYLNYRIEHFAEVMAEDASEQVETSDAVNAGDAPAATEAGDFDLEAALKPRILGDTSAPIKISEHASFSCGHCGDFHKNVFKELKAAYIDTGKAYLVFSDFPLNAPALHATMAARCVAEDKFFDFTAELFEKQKDWAYSPSYLAKLKTMAGTYGLDGKAFDACVKNEELQAGIIAGVQAAQSQWNVRATPSFVINNQITIGGAHNFADFEKSIQDALAKIENGE